MLIPASQIVPNPPDHPREVAVANQSHLVLELDVESLAQTSSRCGRFAGDQRPTTRTRSSPELSVTRTRSRGVARRRALGLRQLDPALLGDHGGVDDPDVLLGVIGEHPEQRLDRQQAGIALCDPAEELRLDTVDRRAFEQGDGDLAERPG